jgi:hypothetical protein
MFAGTPYGGAPSGSAQVGSAIVAPPDSYAFGKFSLIVSGISSFTQSTTSTWAVKRINNAKTVSTFDGDIP